MGCPLFQAPESSAAAGSAASVNCPEWPPAAAVGDTTAPRRWRPLVQPSMLHPSMEELGSGSSEAGWSEWTRSIRRSLRQRAEVFHTQAPAEREPAPEPEPGTSQPAEEAGGEAASAADGGKRKRGGVRHKFSLRLGYDPRVFLEDPALRGQQLTPEAEAWAAEFRARIPMATDPQLARRLEPEQPPAAARVPQPAVPAMGRERSFPPTSSEEEDEAGVDENAFRIWGRHLASRARARRPPDDPPVTLFVLERLAQAQDARFTGATIQERLSRVSEAIAAATRELNRADLPAQERERMIQWHTRRVQRLQQLQAEWPLPGQAGHEPLAPGSGGGGLGEDGLPELID